LEADHPGNGVPIARLSTKELAAGASFTPGTVHLPDWVESEWLKQFVTEQLVTVKTRRGFAKLEWQKLRERNEALDARVYARAAAWIAGADRWSEARWADLEAQLGAGGDDDGDAPPSAGANATKTAAEPSAGLIRRRSACGRRVFRSSYLS